MSITVESDRIPDGIPQFLCDVCGQSFRFKGNLKRHQLTAHEQLKPFKCSMCPKSFARKADMQVHMRVHTGEKPYSCEECGKNFARISDLRSHERTHRGEKRYACPFPMCERRFTRRVDMRKHELTHASCTTSATKRTLQPKVQPTACNNETSEHSAHARGCGHLSIEHGNHLDFIVNNQLICLQGVKSLVPPTIRHEHPGEKPRQHGPGCGHLAVRHNDHVDYVVDNSLFCQHGGVLVDVDSLKLLDDDFWDFFGAMDSLTTQDEMTSSSGDEEKPFVTTI